MSTAVLSKPHRSDDAPTAPKLASWHFAMVNDRVRNDAIERSIAALDLAGKTVVEIGAGTGLVALLFARHGAARVITCEMNPHLAETARQIVSATPYADRIVVVEGSSGAAIDAGLVPPEHDIIFTETLDCGTVGEGFLAIADDVQRLAGPRTIVMPREVRQVATLVESRGLDELNCAGSACGFRVVGTEEVLSGADDDGVDHQEELVDESVRQEGADRPAAAHDDEVAARLRAQGGDRARHVAGERRGVRPWQLSVGVRRRDVLGGVVEAVLERAADRVPVAEHVVVAAVPEELRGAVAEPAADRFAHRGVVAGLGPAAVRESAPGVLGAPTAGEVTLRY